MFDFPSDPVLNQSVTVAGHSYVWNGLGWLLDPPIAAHGQCVLGLEGANLVLRPCDGNKLVINGRAEIVPDGGVSLGTGGVTNNVINYVYAFMTGATVTLELSTTSPSRDSATGIQIKLGNTTRTLVGMAYPIAGAFVSSASRALVRTWFNDPGVVAYSILPAQVTTASTTVVTIHASFFVDALVWNGEKYSVELSGSVSVTGAGMGQYTQILIGGISVGGVSLNGYGGWTPFGISAPAVTASPDKYIQATPSGFCSAAGGLAYWYYSASYGGCGVMLSAEGRS